MTERWRKRLGELGGTEPSRGLWQRIESGDAARASRGDTPRRIAVAALALTVAAAGTYFGWRALGNRPIPGPANTPEGYFMSFPESARATTDINGGADLQLSTNLPDGTCVSLAYQVFMPDRTAPWGAGYGMCFKVEGGMAVVTVRDSTCYNLAGRVGDSSAFSATLTVSVTDPNAVVIRGGIGPRPSPPPYQPESVRAVLGERFERLTGPQVTERGDERVIVITRRYEWPDGRCAPTRGIFMPDQCPATSQQLQADNVHGAASEILAQLSQERLCEMWDLSLTPDAEQRHPYPEFIDEIDTWIQTLGDLGAGADDFALSRREIGSNGLRHEVELVLRGTPVARLVILELPDAPHAHDAGVTTFWGLDDYTLLPAPPA